MKKPKKCIKVVSIRYNGDLSSVCLQREFPDEFRVTYKPGEWIKPRVSGTRLWVFLELEEAKRFVSQHMFLEGTYQYWEAEYREDPKKTQPICVEFLHYILKRRSLWKQTIRNVLSSSCYLDCPDGPRIVLRHDLFYTVPSLRLLNRIEV